MIIPTAIAAIICAAGTSRRFLQQSSPRLGGIKKEYRLLPGAADGKLTVLGAAVSAFAAISEINTIVIVVPDDPLTGEDAARKALPPEFLAEKARPAIRFVSGGPKRQASVFKALSLLAADPTPNYVLIHDGARPWVSPSLIKRIIAELAKHPAVIPVLPLAETPKETDLPLGSSDTVFIKHHLKRAFIGSAQTPQGFAFPGILAAHQKAAGVPIEFTDDAEVWASFCGPEADPEAGLVSAIFGEPENRKITFPEDLL